MKNRKMVLGAIILLFAITGICNIPNVSAEETIDIPPLMYVYYYMGYLEDKDEIVITEIKVLDAGIGESVNVYIMNERQFDRLQDTGYFSSEKMWENTIWLSGWSIDITEDDYYYVIIYNEALLSTITVLVDIGVRHYTPPVKDDNFFLGWLLFIILPVIVVVVVVAVLVIKHKRKIPVEVIKPERTPIKTYCSKCGIEILGKLREFCFNCGTKIN